MNRIEVYIEANQAFASFEYYCSNGIKAAIYQTNARPVFIPTSGPRRIEPADADTYYVVISNIIDIRTCPPQGT